MTVPRLQGRSLTIAYDERVVVDDLTLALPDGRITCIIGANASGKSTVLRTMARLLRPVAGSVVLDGRDVHALPTKELARALGVLPQSPSSPTGITVADLVGRGRYAHQTWRRPWSAADDAAVTEALEITGTVDLATRSVDELSGGQRQRVWIALVLAQQTDILLLDEPTTYLDLAHQIEVLDLLVDLNAAGRTVAVVLHDLNHAARYCHHLVAMKAGRIVAAGRPSEVITAELVRSVYGIRSEVVPDPVTGAPMVVPIGRHSALDPPGRSATKGLDDGMRAP